MRKLALPALVLVILGLALLVWRAIEGATVLEDHAAGTASTDAQSPLPSNPAGELDALPAASTGVELADADSSAEIRTIATSGPTFELEVVWRSTNAPVAGAHVVLATVALHEQHMRRDALTDFWEVLGERTPEGVARAKTNERGVTVLPILDTSVVVRAWIGGDARVHWFQPIAGRRERVVLEPEHFVLARVVGQDGKPVERVPVRFCTRDPSKGSVWDGVRALTGADGLARVRVPTERPLGEADEFGVRLGIVAREREFRTVDLEHLPADPLEFVLPACGVVRARTTRAGGPVVFQTLRIAPAGSSAKGSALDPDERGDDWARWGFVALGLGVKFDAWVDGFENEAFERRGPTTAGEAVEVELELSKALPIVRGRCLDDAGRPITDAQLLVRIVQQFVNGPQEVYHASRTDAGGAFELCVRLRNRSTSQLAAVIEVQSPSEWVGFSARAPLALPLPETTELGTIVLAPQPVILDGVVVDDAGAPLADATVFVIPDADDPRTQGAVAATKPMSKVLQTDTEGRFRAFGEPWAWRARVDVHRTGFGRVQKLLFEPGARDVRIVMLRSGAVEGELLLGERMQLGWLRVEFVPAGAREGDRSAPTIDAKCTLGNRFVAADLAPGTYTLHAGFRSGETLVSVPNVVVAAGATTTLAPVDLRHAFHVFELAVTDPEGKPIASATCVYSDGLAAKPQRIAVNAGHALLFPRALPFSLAVGAEGLRTGRVLDATGDVNVQLQRGPRARLVLEPSFNVPPGVELLTETSYYPEKEPLTLYYPGQLETAKEWQWRTLGPGVEVELQLTEPGRYLVKWNLGALTDPKLDIELARTSSRWIQVLETTAEQRFVLVPNAEDVTKALDELNAPR